MLEVFVTCLHHYATLLKDKQAAQDQGLGDYLYFYKDMYLCPPIPYYLFQYFIYENYCKEYINFVVISI